MTLRDQCVEAAALRLALGKYPIGHRNAWLDEKIRQEAERDAAAAFDAILDTLSADILNWLNEADAMSDHWGDVDTARDLLAALRNPNVEENQGLSGQEVT